MHGDEANQAYKAGLKLFEEGVYLYDPGDHHGPSLYYLTLPILALSGARTFAETTESEYRLLPVLFGIGLVLLLWPLGAGLGRAAAVVAAVLTALSPAMVFYSRYYIQETLLVFFTLATILAVWRYMQTGDAACTAPCAVGLLTHRAKTTAACPVRRARGGSGDPPRRMVPSGVAPRGGRMRRPHARDQGDVGPPCGRHGRRSGPRVALEAVARRPGGACLAASPGQGRPRGGGGAPGRRGRVRPVLLADVPRGGRRAFLRVPGKSARTDRLRPRLLRLLLPGGRSGHARPSVVLVRRHARLVARRPVAGMGQGVGPRVARPGPGGPELERGPHRWPGGRRLRGVPPAKDAARRRRAAAAVLRVLHAPARGDLLGHSIQDALVRAHVPRRDDRPGGRRPRRPGAMGAAGPAKIAVGLVAAALVVQLGGQAWRTSTAYAADRRNPYVYAHTSRDCVNMVERIEALAAVSPKGAACSSASSRTTTGRCRGTCGRSRTSAGATCPDPPDADILILSPDARTGPTPICATST